MQRWALCRSGSGSEELKKCPSLFPSSPVICECSWEKTQIERKTYAFQSESTIYSCLNVKKVLAENRCDIWSLSKSTEFETTNRLTSLAKWLSFPLQTKWLRIQIPLVSWYLLFKKMQEWSYLLNEEILERLHFQILNSWEISCFQCQTSA